MQHCEVRAGETLTSISIREKVSVPALRRINKLYGNEIFPGQILSLQISTNNSPLRNRNSPVRNRNSPVRNRNSPVRHRIIVDLTNNDSSNAVGDTFDPGCSKQPIVRSRLLSKGNRESIFRAGTAFVTSRFAVFSKS